jgi:putative endonuclease
MISSAAGQKAEIAAATYLEMRGYAIIERNFRRPRCEIDIIASKDDTVYFVEVKYRKIDDQGSGFDAITQTKLRQMRFAADYWIEECKWSGPYQLGAIEVAGQDFAVMNFIDNAYL